MSDVAPSIRVMLVNAHQIFLEAVRSLVQEAGDMAVVGAQTSVLGALALAREIEPTVAVIDVSLPDSNGLMLAKRIAAEVPSTHVVILSALEDEAFVRRALRSGVSGYVLKRSAGEGLLEAVRAVVSDGIYVDPKVAGRFPLPGPRAHSGRRGAAGIPDGPSLTERETEVLRFVALGYTTKEIAARLDVTAKSVETYKARGCEKLDLRTRTQIVQYAATQGWFLDL